MAVIYIVFITNGIVITGLNYNIITDNLLKIL